MALITNGICIKRWLATSSRNSPQADIHHLPAMRRGICMRTGRFALYSHSWVLQRPIRVRPADINDFAQILIRVLVIYSREERVSHEGFQPTSQIRCQRARPRNELNISWYHAMQFKQLLLLSHFLKVCSELTELYCATFGKYHGSKGIGSIPCFRKTS